MLPRLAIASLFVLGVGTGLVHPAAADLPPAPPGVQVTTAYGIQFATIGNSGNPSHYVGLDNSTVERNVGSINYEYGLSRTEITTAQWFQFVQAYRPYYTGAPNDSDFLGIWINYSPTTGYSYAPENANKPVAVSWGMAARYCNWLCNNQGNTAAAFNSGAYDVSTFGTGPQGPFLDQMAHTPGAQYWLPTQDEWIKGAYYDPNRLGPGSGGYWLYPNRSDSPPIPGTPGTPGATTNAGVIGDFLTDVASYPDAQSAYGLFDISGGEKEWSETINDPGFSRNRLAMGSVHGDALYQFYDYIDREGGDLIDYYPPYSGGEGIRIASAIPAASPSGMFLLGGAVLLRRRRRCESSFGGPSWREQCSLA